MADQNSQSEGSELEREVKEFGDTGHVTLPKDWIGESVTIQLGSADAKPLQPPITTESLKSTLRNASREDFSQRIREKDNYPREGVFQYDDDLRLSIDVEIVDERDAQYIAGMEKGRISYNLHEPTEEELLEHAPWWTEEYQKKAKEAEYQYPAVLVCFDPAAAELFDSPRIEYGDLYRYTITWNGDKIASFKFKNRGAANGRFYLPRWSEYASLEEYQSSLAYALATAISSAPTEDYDRYLEIMTERGIGWGGKEDNDARRDLTHEEKLRQTIICQP